MRRSSAILTVVIAFLSLGCASIAPAVPGPPAPAPLTDAARDSAYRLQLDLDWLPIAQQYPDAVRPDVELVREAAPENWDSTIGNCYRDAGFRPSGDAEAWQWSVPEGMEGRISQYVCDARFPREGTLDRLLSGSELYALYDYNVEFLTPCLSLLGVPPAGQAPDLATFLQQSTTGPAWSPIAASDRRLTETDRRVNELVCPSEPAWMRDRSP